MSETLERCSALRHVLQPGRYGSMGTESSLIVTERHPLAIVQVAAYPTTATLAADAIAAVVGIAPALGNAQGVAAGDATILWVGPQRWCVVVPEEQNPASALRERLGLDAAITDQSHARAVIRLQGPALRALLAKGAGMDFHPHRFGPGWCRPLSFAHLGVFLHCVTEDTADIYVPRSFAVSFWEWLLASAAEFGVVVR